MINELLGCATTTVAVLSSQDKMDVSRVDLLAFLVFLRHMNKLNDKMFPVIIITKKQIGNKHFPVLLPLKFDVTLP